MKCIFAFVDSGRACGWFLVSRSEKLDFGDLRYFVDFYGKKNVRLKCGDYDFEDYGFLEEDYF